MPNNNWKVMLSRDGSEKPATLAAFRAEPPMQYAGQSAHQQLLEHNRAVRRRSDGLRATAAYPRGCMAAAEREPRETTRARRMRNGGPGGLAGPSVGFENGGSGRPRSPPSPRFPCVRREQSRQQKVRRP